VSNSNTGSYRQSHTGAGKGAAYDRNFDHRYRAYLWDREREALGAILTRYFPDGGFRHLDFACGTGRILGFVAPASEASTGVDVSDAMMSEAESKAPDARLVRADVTQEQPFGDERFDLITAFRFFPNAEDQLRVDVAAALSRLGSEGGLLVFNNHKNAHSFVGRAMRFWCWIRGRHFRTMDRADIDALTARTGWEIVEVVPTGIFPGYEWLMFLPSSWYAVIDRGLARLPGAAGWALNQIVVCRKSSNG